MQRDIVVVGHPCHDTLLSSSGERTELGGSAAYACAVLDPLGIDHVVVGSVGSDFRFRGRLAHPPRIVEGARTTAFVDDDRGGERVSTAVERAPPIEPGELRERCAVGMACGIAGEIGAATLLRLRELSEVLVVDAQAVVRAFGAGGRVEHRTPSPEMLRALAAADWVKASRAEAGAVEGAGLPCGLIVTDGPRGCSLLHAGSTVRVDAFPAVEVDPTGAGDCFLAGFAAGLLRRWDASRAARFGAFCGALAVEQHGVPRLTRDRLEAFPG